VNILTVMLAYQRTGRPSTGAPTLGNFEVWTRVVRDALLWGDPDDRANQGGRSGAAELDSVLDAWNRAFGADRTTCAGAVEKAMADTNPDLREALSEACQLGGQLSPEALGYWMRTRTVGSGILGCAHTRTVGSGIWCFGRCPISTGSGGLWRGVQSKQGMLCDVHPPHRPGRDGHALLIR
jgi:hypothetical protein